MPTKGAVQLFNNHNNDNNRLKQTRSWGCACIILSSYQGILTACGNLRAEIQPHKTITLKSNTGRMKRQTNLCRAGMGQHCVQFIES